MSSTDDSQQFTDCQPSKPYSEQLPIIVSSFQGTVGNIWTGHNASNTGSGLTVECIQTGETLPIDNCSTAIVFPSTSHEKGDSSDELVCYQSAKFHFQGLKKYKFNKIGVSQVS